MPVSWRVHSSIDSIDIDKMIIMIIKKIIIYSGGTWYKGIQDIQCFTFCNDPQSSIDDIYLNIYMTTRKFLSDANSTFQIFLFMMYAWCNAMM